MKKIKLLSILALIGFTFFISCTDDDVESTVPSNFTLNSAVNISSDQAGNTIDINGDNISNSLINVNWDSPSATQNTVIRHTVQLAAPGSNFANPINLSTIIGNAVSISGTDLNNAVASMGALPGVNFPIEMRVNSSIDNETFLASNVLSFTVNAYDADIPEGAFLYVANDYPNWNFTTAEKLTSPNDDGIYGSPYYVFSEASTFNLVDPTGQVWGAGDAFDGQFIQNGAPIMISNAGMYDFQVNPSAETFSATQLVWGVIGSATPMGWDNETALTLDLGTGIWSGEVELIEGELKFRANNTWDINLGDNGLDGSLEPGGANIPNMLVGLTPITLDFSDPFNPTYKVGDADPVEPIMSGNFLYLSTDGMTTAGMENIYSFDADGNYAGYAYLMMGTTYSLIDPDLDMGAVQNTMTVDETALYRVTVDLANETMGAYKLDSWGIIGTASPTAGWDSDADMTFDPMNKMITGSVALTEGEFKFRANDDWAVNLGDTNADGTLEQDGSNLVNATAGTYTITINLSDDSGYTYTIQ